MSGDRGHGGASGFPRPGKGAGVGAAAKGGNRRGTNGWGRRRGMRRNAVGGWILSAPAERRHVLPESFAAVSTLSLGGREEAVCAFILFNRGCKGDGRTRGWDVV